MTSILDLPRDIYKIMLHFVAEERFSLVPGYLPKADATAPITIKTYPDGQFYGGKSTIVDWKTLTRDWFTVNKTYRVTQGDVKSLWRVHRACLANVATFSAVCRQWSEVVEPLWKMLFERTATFFPLILQRAKDKATLQLVTPSVDAGTSFSAEWARLALKYACRNGRKLAKQTIKFKQVDLTKPNQKKRGLKPQTLYVVRLNGTRMLRQGKDVDPQTATVELRITEKVVDGHNYWKHASIAHVDAALQRHRQILKETRELRSRLRKCE